MEYMNKDCISKLLLKHSFACPIQDWGQGTYLSCHRVRGRIYLGQVTSLSQD